MSTETPTNAPKPGAPSLETSVSKDESTSFENGSATVRDGEGVSAQFEGKDPVEVKTGLGGAEEGAETGSEGDGAEGTTTDDKPADGAPEPLPAWNPDDENVLAEYDQRYFKEDGSLDVRGSLSQEFWANYKADPEAFKDPTKGGLNEQTYDYLKDRLGLSRDDVLQVERGQLAVAQQSEQKFYNDVGGKARWEAAVEWGRSTYTKEQQDRFNAAMAKGGADAEDAAEALMGRYDRKNPRQPVRRGPPPRRSSTPQRDATRGAANGGQGGGSKDIFASAAEYNTAISEARKAGDQKLIDSVRAKGRRSNLK